MMICITGMHRSGTSLVAHLLHLCGLYLGAGHDMMAATVDNENGYWENTRFVAINEEILKKLGAAWNFPPVVPDGWADEKKFRSLRVEAETLLEDFKPHEFWGWKDPRNCLTLPFWRTLAPRLKFIICLRNPLEVFRSLQGRKFTPDSSGIKLWSIYNQTILNSTLPEDRIVTHYEAYFHDADAELHRVFNFLDMHVPDELIRQSSLIVSNRLRHNRAKIEHSLEKDAGTEVYKLYRAMCLEAKYPASGIND